MNQRYPKAVRLRSRRQFQRIAHQCTRHVGNWIVVEARPNKNTLTKLGITVTRRYGKAVQRNRFKRLVREAFRRVHTFLHPGIDLNVKPRNQAGKAKMEDVLNELLRFAGFPK